MNQRSRPNLLQKNFTWILGISILYLLLMSIPWTIYLILTPKNLITKTIVTPKTQHLSDNLTLATYNVGLLSTVPFRSQRLAQIPTALKHVDADILCLQEAWEDQDSQTLEQELATTYPYGVRERTEKTDTVYFSCNPHEILVMEQCQHAKCEPNKMSSEACVQTKCKDTYTSLSDTCKQCLSSNSHSPLTCLFRSNPFLEDGRNGLILLSKYPIEHPELITFNLPTVNRAFIHATIQNKHIICTHLSPDSDIIPYLKQSKSFQTWTDEQTAEIKKINDTFLQDNLSCQILMGDLNTSPDQAELSPESENILSSLHKLGFQEPWTSPTCTWCPAENPLVGYGTKKWYDHILFRNCNGQKTYQRILDTPIDIKENGKNISTNLSDHFGVIVKFISNQK